MANTFKNALVNNVGTTGNTIYTCPSATQTTVIGLSVANKSDNSITCNAFITSSSVDYFLIRNATVPAGGALVIVGGDQKVVVMANQILKANTSVTSSADIVCSILEIT
jgi:hypothetical protein